MNRVDTQTGTNQDRLRLKRNAPTGNLSGAYILLLPTQKKQERLKSLFFRSTLSLKIASKRYHTILQARIEPENDFTGISGYIRRVKKTRGLTAGKQKKHKQFKGDFFQATLHNFQPTMHLISVFKNPYQTFYGNFNSVIVSAKASPYRSLNLFSRPHFSCLLFLNSLL